MIFSTFIILLRDLGSTDATLFIPYTILRLRPKLKAERKQILTPKELTEFVEVHQMTKTLLKLPSMIEDELRAEIADQKSQLADQKSQLAAQKTQIADQEAEIRRLQELVDQLSAHTYR